MIALNPMPHYAQPIQNTPYKLQANETIKTEQIYKQLCQQFWGGDIQPLDESWQKRFQVYQAWSHADCQKEQFENKVSPGDHSSWLMESGELLLINKKDNGFEIVNWHTGQLTCIDKGNFRPPLCATAINANYFICRDHKEIAFFDRQSGLLVDTWEHRSHSPFLLACNDHFLASVNEDKVSVTLWDIQTRQPYWSIEETSHRPIWMLKLSGKYLAIEHGGSPSIFIADMEQKCIHAIQHGFCNFLPIEFIIHSDQMAAIEERSGRIKVWDLKHMEAPCQEFEGISPLPGCENYRHMGAMCHPMDAFLVTSGYFDDLHNGHSIFEVIDMRTNQIILKQKIEANILKIFVEDSQVTIVFEKGITVYNFAKLHTHFYLADCLEDKTNTQLKRDTSSPEVKTSTPNVSTEPASPPRMETEIKEDENFRYIENVEEVEEKEVPFLKTATKVLINAPQPKQPSLLSRIYYVVQQILMAPIHQLHHLYLWTWSWLQSSLEKIVKGQKNQSDIFNLQER